jgi:ribosome maturation factor RimP
MIEKIEAHLLKLFEEEEFQDCFLVEINASGLSRVEIYVDADTGIDFTRCRKISRYLEAEIEEQGWMNEQYTIEVSSPGVDRPLKFKRQYTKNIGRKLAVIDDERHKTEGLLIAVDEEQITLEYKDRIKEGKRKKTVILQKEIKFENIEKAFVKISF